MVLEVWMAVKLVTGRMHESAGNFLFIDRSVWRDPEVGSFLEIKFRSSGVS